MEISKDYEEFRNNLVNELFGQMDCYIAEHLTTVNGDCYISEGIRDINYGDEVYLNSLCTKDYLDEYTGDIRKFKIEDGIVLKLSFLTDSKSVRFSIGTEGEEFSHYSMSKSIDDEVYAMAFIAKAKNMLKEFDEKAEQYKKRYTEDMKNLGDIIEDIVKDNDDIPSDSVFESLGCYEILLDEDKSNTTKFEISPVSARVTKTKTKDSDGVEDTSSMLSMFSAIVGDIEVETEKIQFDKSRDLKEQIKEFIANNM